MALSATGTRDDSMGSTGWNGVLICCLREKYTEMQGFEGFENLLWGAQSQNRAEEVIVQSFCEDSTGKCCICLKRDDDFLSVRIKGYLVPEESPRQ